MSIGKIDSALLSALSGTEEVLEGYPAACAALKKGYFSLAKARSHSANGFLMSTHGVPPGPMEPRVRVECTL